MCGLIEGLVEQDRRDWIRRHPVLAVTRVVLGGIFSIASAAAGVWVVFWDPDQSGPNGLGGRLIVWAMSMTPLVCLWPIALCRVVAALSERK